MEGTLRVVAWLACVMVVGQVLLFFVTGVGQDPLQFVHPPEEYLRILLKSPSALRAVLAMDNAFIVFYTTVFLALGALLERDGANRGLLWTAIGALLLTAFLDMVENFHFMAMLGHAELGIAPSSGEIEAQVFESLLKFHVSYLGLFLLGFVMPRRSVLERLFVYLSWYVQLPVGILIYVTPQAVSVPLVFVRFAYFVAALLLLAEIYRRRAEQA
jgi:hypothetical protein